MRKTNEETMNQIRRGLVVSCQALPEEPLHSSYIMGKMAYAAFLGGAKGIRANTVADIREIRKNVNLPIIGIIKKVYGDNPVFITPTLNEVEELVMEGVEIIAVDATNRVRPDGKSLKDFFMQVRKKYPQQLFMADCSKLEDTILAKELGFDLLGSTLAGYTDDTKGVHLPDYGLLENMIDVGLPVIAEGGISTPEDLGKVMELPVYCAVVGSAITRPMEITKRFSSVI
ncbi:N-acetylmannosamine-6-phosphate 2-epimerase [Proteiniclasticum ruminis]|uniref:Putative N-acetylmannosamine-6-phosphate 2-epimerase n=1 Tax=Proteiniclasticum ruminis TaxID=398199 RepID=A0A1G8JW79_9CLOT|nr:N-acetylmannosamine-6-phosphate 2-epimerase [Proteiniclasticum ruminis]SDI35449.1 N-acylglucosamine-6-phosphate 2-epimerase [Proteiniclasticum ruminis]